MHSPVKFIVGLANPGKEYISTRHNAGAWFIDEIAQGANATLRPEMKFHGLHALAHIQHHPCHLLIPTTFMNHSGQAVRAFMSYHKIMPSNLLVAHDDIDLPVGAIRLKYDGGDGGHNGLKDIIRHLNSKQFYRLRIGVGRPNSKEVVDYVLNPPSKVERKQIDDAIISALAILPFLLEGEIQKAMQTLHTASEE